MDSTDCAKEIDRILAAHPEPEPCALNLRMWDLLRCVRTELHDQKLITDDEYGQLASSPPGVTRFESYEDVSRLQREALDAERALCDRLIKLERKIMWLKCLHDAGVSIGLSEVFDMAEANLAAYDKSRGK